MYEPKNCFIVVEIDGECAIEKAFLSQKEADELMDEEYYPYMDSHPYEPVSYFVVKKEF